MLVFSSRRIFQGLLNVLLCLAFLGLSSSAFAELLKVPELNSRVTDLTKTLSADEKSTIEASLAEFEKAKGSQVAVLVVNSTSPEVIEDYSLRVVDQWKLGRKGVDDGVLLLIALKDKKMRIEVGYGLEGAIPDISAGRIINEFISPEFRRGNIAAGIEVGTTHIINLINGEPLPEPTSKQGVKGGDWVSILMFYYVATMMFGPKLKSLLGSILSVSIISLFASSIVWYFLGNIWIALGAGLFIGLFHLSSIASSGSSYQDGGGYGGGFGGGGSSGGGGFSGGGGGFGGGGASGGW